MINAFHHSFKSTKSTSLVQADGAVLEVLGLVELSEEVALPFFKCKISAGFPSPADDYLEERLLLDKRFIKNPQASFILQAKGNSMVDIGIFDKSYLVVDRSLVPLHNDIVIVGINGDHTVKRLNILPSGKMYLSSENPSFANIELNDELDNIIWGVVMCVVNQYKL
jgi:DNA polymerase V